MPTLYQPQAIEKAIQAVGVNADYINSLLAESWCTHLRKETLQSLLQKDWSGDRRNGPVLHATKEGIEPLETPSTMCSKY